MLVVLILLFTVLPIVEIGLIVALGQSIGWLPTVALALATGVVGASLARRQGLATVARLSRQLAAGETPADALVDGAMILLAGALLVTPGVLTDATGFALLLPPVRRALKPLLRQAMGRALRRHVERGGAVWVWSAGGPPRAPGRDGPIEAEVVRIRSRDAD